MSIPATAITAAARHFPTTLRKALTEFANEYGADDIVWVQIVIEDESSHVDSGSS